MPRRSAWTKRYDPREICAQLRGALVVNEPTLTTYVAHMRKKRMYEGMMGMGGAVGAHTRHFLELFDGWVHGAQHVGGGGASTRLVVHGARGVKLLEAAIYRVVCVAVGRLIANRPHNDAHVVAVTQHL
jgi:hypothetical protein